MSYTPRQMFFFLSLAKKRMARETLTKFSLAATAASGNAKAIREQQKSLKKETV